MPKVNTMHSHYIASQARWKRCRDFVEGSDAVKASGELYLPKLGGQTPAEYLAYKSRAQLFNASGRTVDAMTGLVMRIDPIVNVPAALEALTNDVDYMGTGLYEFAKCQVSDLLTVGRSGILVDFPGRPDTVVTKAQAEGAGLRPYLAHYTAENIINWRTDRVGGKTNLVLVVLKEVVFEKTADEFVQVEIQQRRVLDLDDSGNYRQRVYRLDEKQKDEWKQHGADIYPTAKNKPLKEIPFIFIGTESNTTDIQKPPVADLVEVNLGHYVNSADHEHGLHFTGLPTPVITGHMVPEGESLSIGSESFLVLKNPAASAFFLEFTGTGLAALVAAMDAKKEQMAVLGARMLASEKKGVEAAETAEIHRSGEAGVLSSIAGSVAKGIRTALQMAGQWVGAGDAEIEFDLNRDFLPSSMDATMLKELLAAWQSGGISHAVLFDQLKRGEIIRDGQTLEEMIEDINNTVPGLTEPKGSAGAE